MLTNSPSRPNLLVVASSGWLYPEKPVHNTLNDFSCLKYQSIIIIIMPNIEWVCGCLQNVSLTCSIHPSFINPSPSTIIARWSLFEPTTPPPPRRLDWDEDMRMMMMALTGDTVLELLPLLLTRKKANINGGQPLSILLHHFMVSVVGCRSGTWKTWQSENNESDDTQSGGWL